jgi:two-component system, NtrC family, response regulator HupR/HoxA
LAQYATTARLVSRSKESSPCNRRHGSLSFPFVDDSRGYLGLHTVGMLRELIRKWWQVDIGFADASGRLLDEAWGNIPASGNDFCRALLAATPGRKRCLKSVREINSRLRNERGHAKPVAHVCHLGLGMIASPVLTRDHYRGFVFACGHSNRELSRTRVARLRATVAEILAAKTPLDGERIPVLNREDIERLKDLLTYGAGEIAQFDKELSRQAVAVSAEHDSAFTDIVSRSGPMAETSARLKKLARASTPIVLAGPEGTGKRVLARAIHLAGPRRKGPFLVFEKNGEAASVETGLFGQARSGSIGRLGALEKARGGSIYLASGSWLAPEVQVKLMRTLQESTMVPVGAARPVEVDTRLLLGLESGLEQATSSGILRSDLADWLSPHVVVVPSLSERTEDIRELIEVFLRRHTEEGRSLPLVPAEVLGLLQRYSWPGNAAELEDEVRSWLSLSPPGEPLSPDFLSLRIRQAAGHGSQALTKALRATRDLKQAQEILEREMIHEGLVRTRWNKSLLARELGISRSNLLAKIEKYQLDKSRLSED